ncbi:MAG: DUF3089 domain-containing protein [Myxococcales bacterium]|nr:DUF3089 domain-containing protein [Myxococcales bacterium]
MRYLFGFNCVLALSVVGCSETAGMGGSGGDGGSGGEGGAGAYASKDLWLCRPDIENDQCDMVDLSFTEIQPDGSQVTGDVIENSNAEVDCFYVYHTVNLSPIAENTETLSPTDPAVLKALHRDGVHFRELCRVFAPLYHQMSLITYTEFWPFWEQSEFYQRGYDDIVDAFEYYLRNHNDGRDIVLLGHSQGAHVLTTLLADKFDDDEALRGQLLSAVLIGPTGLAQVPQGAVVGGSFENIPVCTSASQTGCVIAFDGAAARVDSYIDYAVLIEPPMVRGCVNPASFDGSSGTLTSLLYPRSSPLALPFPDTVDTEWVRYPDVYKAQCSDETHYLEVDVVSESAGEAPFTPQELQEAIVANGGQNNLHYGGETFTTMPDLVRILEQQIASRGN